PPPAAAPGKDAFWSLQHRHLSATTGEGLGVEEVGRQADALGGQVLGEGRANAGGLEPAPELAGLLVDSLSKVEQEQVLEGDHLTFHAFHLGDVGDAAGAVAETSDVDDE